MSADDKPRDLTPLVTPLARSKPYLRCATCRELKPSAEFPVDYSKISGHKGNCFTCVPPVAEKPKPEFSPRVIEAMCGKKHRYGKQGIALAAALRSAKRTRSMRVYRCPICKGWHLTHKAERESA